MTRAIALAQPIRAVTIGTDPVELARRLIVLGCAVALILAGQALPF